MQMHNMQPARGINAEPEGAPDGFFFAPANPSLRKLLLLVFFPYWLLVPSYVQTVILHIFRKCPVPGPMYTRKGQSQ